MAGLARSSVRPSRRLPAPPAITKANTFKLGIKPGITPPLARLRRVRSPSVRRKTSAGVGSRLRALGRERQTGTPTARFVPVGEEGIHLVNGQRSREKVTLAVGASEGKERVELCLFLDPLGDDAEVQSVRQLDDRARQGGFLRPPCDATDEGS